MSNNKVQWQILTFLYLLEDKCPIGRFLLAVAEGLHWKFEGPIGKKNVTDERSVKGRAFGPISKNVKDERGVKKGPLGPISKKHDGRTGCYQCSNS